MRRTWQVAVALTLAFMTTGCLGPSAKIEKLRCIRFQDPKDKVLTGFGFESTIDATNLEDQQLVYRVELVDWRGKPILSNDGRFQNDDGQVAATKALVVLRPDWTFEGIAVRIPANELGVHPDDMPAWARVGIYSPSGECLDYKWARLPIQAPYDFDRMGATVPHERP